MTTTVTVGTTMAVRLLVLDATTNETLNASVDALTSEDYLTLARAVDTAPRREQERDLFSEIRAVLNAMVTDGRTPIGVLFRADPHRSDLLSRNGTVLFEDGTTEEMVFDDAEEIMMDLYEGVGGNATLVVDLRTNTLDFSCRRALEVRSVHARFFGLAESEASDDERIVALVRTTLAGNDQRQCASDLSGAPIGVQFKSRPEEDGYYLSSDTGFVLFDGGDISLVTFPGIAAVFAKAVGRVGDRYSLTVDLRGEGAVIREEHGLTPLDKQFGLQD